MFLGSGRGNKGNEWLCREVLGAAGLEQGMELVVQAALVDAEGGRWQ